MPSQGKPLYDKILVERVALGCPDLPGTVLRLPMVHGTGDPYRRLSPYLKRMDDGRPAIVLDELAASWKAPRGFVDHVAAAIAAAVLDDRAAGRVYNVADAATYAEADWIRRIGEAAGWGGRVVVAPAGRIAYPCHLEQSVDTDARRIRRELGVSSTTTEADSLARTIAWERANPAAGPSAIALLDYEAEDALLAELGRS